MDFSVRVSFLICQRSRPGGDVGLGLGAHDASARKRVEPQSVDRRVGQAGTQDLGINTGTTA
jgi:hypothetical protein